MYACCAHRHGDIQTVVDNQRHVKAVAQCFQLQCFGVHLRTGCCLGAVLHQRHAALERLTHAVYKRPALQAAIVRNQINTVIRLCFHQDTFSSGFRFTRFHFVVTW